jgi:hypothetical protein
VAELDAPYLELIEHIKQQGLIAVINDRLRYFEEQGYQKLLTKLIELTTPKSDSNSNSKIVSLIPSSDSLNDH